MQLFWDPILSPNLQLGHYRAPKVVSVQASF